MSDIKTLEEIMDAFYAAHPAHHAEANWRDSPVPDDDDGDGEDEGAPDFDMVIAEFVR